MQTKEIKHENITSISDGNISMIALEHSHPQGSERLFLLQMDIKRSTMKEQHRDDSIIQRGPRAGIPPPPVNATKTNVFPGCNK